LRTAKALRRARARSGNRTVNESDESPATDIGIPATGKDIVAERLEPGTQPENKQEGTGNVVVGGVKAPNVEGEGDDLHSHFFGTVVEPGGTDVGGDPESDVGTMGTVPPDVDGDPGEQREGDTEPAEMSSDEVLDGEYCVPVQQEGEGEMATEGGAAAAPAAPALRPRAKDSPAHPSDSELLGKPGQLKGRGKAWQKEAAELLKTYAPPTSTVRQPMHSTTTSGGQRCCGSDTDPFTYFASKLPELLEQVRTAERGAVLKPDPKRSESPHGKQKATARKSKQQLVDDANQAGADKILRDVRGLP
jgi:hypothetical protein